VGLLRFKHEIRKLFWKAGYDIAPFTPALHPIARKRRLLTEYAIDTVLDVGANTGQFAREWRDDLGYTGRILSFEPMSAAFKELVATTECEAFNYALGDVNEQREINIAQNSYSSSLLDMLPAHLNAAPDSQYVGKETVTVKTLDSVFDELCAASKNIYMKIDTQGFESNVLKGAERSLPRIGMIQMEMSLVPLYGGQMLFEELLAFMREKGYRFVGIESEFSDPRTGDILQVNGFFRRR